MSKADYSTTADRLLEDLEQAVARLEEAKDGVDDFGLERIEELAEAYREFTALLDRYEDEVVGDAGDIQTNVEFQSQIAETVNGMPSGMLLHETFVDCAQYLKQKWFHASDFEHVREQLAPVADIVARLEAYNDAQAEYRDARQAIRRRIRELDGEIDDLERLVELSDADLDAPTERLRNPIDQYNSQVEAAFEEFLAEQSAREVISFLESTSAYPLVPFELPPAELRDYLRTESPGEETIHTLLEYAGYSRSKLDHYVDDPDRFDHIVSHQKTYLSGLSAEPLTIDWPPPPAPELRYRCQELTALCNRLSTAVVGPLREVAALPRTVAYERLRRSVVARDQLSDEDRARLQSGAVDDELAEARAAKRRLESALEEYER